MEPTREPTAAPNDTPSPGPAGGPAASSAEGPGPAAAREAVLRAPRAAALAPKADLGKRFIALLIDAVIASVIGLIPIIGWLVGAAYAVVRDGLDVDFMRGRSIGKQIMKLRPVRLDGKPMDLETSLKRNWMFGLGALIPLLLFIPILGWIFFPIVGLAALAIGIYEIIRVVTDEEGIRWGDKIAGTKVIEVDE